MSGAEDLIPKGSMVTARIEILEIIDPNGEEGLSFFAQDGNGDALSTTKFLGMMMQVIMDGWQSKEGDEDDGDD